MSVSDESNMAPSNEIREPETSVLSTSNVDRNRIKEVAKRLYDGITTAYTHFKAYTENANKGLWIKGQKSQHEQALAMAKMPLPRMTDFLDPSYVKSKWIDKNINFWLVILKIINPKIDITKKNMHELPEILFALINDEAFLSQYTKILNKKSENIKKFRKLEEDVDREYRAFREDLRSSHSDPFGFELNPIAEARLRDEMLNDFARKKFEKAGVVWTSKVGPYGGKKTRKRYRKLHHLPFSVFTRNKRRRKNSRRRC